MALTYGCLAGDGGFGEQRALLGVGMLKGHPAFSHPCDLPVCPVACIQTHTRASSEYQRRYAACSLAGFGGHNISLLSYGCLRIQESRLDGINGEQGRSRQVLAISLINLHVNTDYLK